MAAARPFRERCPEPLTMMPNQPGGWGGGSRALGQESQLNPIPDPNLMALGLHVLVCPVGMSVDLLGWLVSHLNETGHLEHGGQEDSCPDVSTNLQAPHSAPCSLGLLGSHARGLGEMPRSF